MNQKVMSLILVVSLLFLVGVVVFAFQRSQSILRSTRRVTTTTSSATPTPGTTVNEIEGDLDQVTLDESETDIEALEQEADNF